MADKLKIYSLIINWDDGDREQGNYAATVRALDEDDAERKVREMMAASDKNAPPAACVNCGCTDNDGSDICPDCGNDIEDSDPREYGSLVECSEGALWQAVAMEAALRDIISSSEANDHGSLMNAIEAARKIIAEIDAIN